MCLYRLPPQCPLRPRWFVCCWCRYGKTIDDADCRQIGHLIRSGALSQVVSLRLSINQISDQGVEEIALALDSRPLPNLSQLWLSDNKVCFELGACFGSAL